MARLSEAKSDEGSTVPRKMDLYWFMPALANRRVGSEWGTTEEEGTIAASAASCGETETPEGRHTKRVAPLLDEIVNKGASDLDSIPLLISGLRSHVESACCGERKVWGARECSRRQLRWNLNLSQPTSATVEQARDHTRF